jgi:hypothetical protein
LSIRKYLKDKNKDEVKCEDKNEDDGNDSALSSWHPKPWSTASCPTGDTPSQ